MQQLWSRMRLVAPHFRCALLLGKLEAGGEAVARALHQLSPMRTKELLVLGAEDAAQRLAGDETRLQRLSQRTIYLPGVEHLTPAAQRGLLRVMRWRGARAVGVIALATHDLRALVSTGSFSSELGSSLSALRIAVPPLRERRDDVRALIHSFVTNFAAGWPAGTSEPLVTEDFYQRAEAHPWPGNLDEMERFLRLLMARAPAELTAADFDAACYGYGQPEREKRTPVRMVRLDHVIDEHTRAVLLACNGNKLRAAEVLGISRSTLYRMLDASAPAPQLSLAS